MIYGYGVTEQGAYHAKRGTPCQDAHHIIKLGDSLAVAAVADGLGSESHSDVASKIASYTSARHCALHIHPSQPVEKILQTIKQAFTAAQDTVEKQAKSKGHDVAQYDTTLTLAVLMGGTLYYGHSGDSGIIALTAEGRYERVTEQQRDEDGHVFPLFFRHKWLFDVYGKKVSSVLLATDGMYEPFFPIFIKNEPVNIHISLARFFMDNRRIRIGERGEDAVRDKVGEYIRAIPAAQVSDDKTVAVLINTAMEAALQPDDYYREPDWAALKEKWDEEWKRKAYPDLYRGSAP
jgi:hypothetical protein